MGRFCTNCGEPLKEGAKFCGSCGEAVEAQAPRKPEEAGRRPYRPTDPRKLQQEVRREAPVQERQQSGGGLWHFLAGTAMGAFLGNLFGGSAEAHNETVVNHNETVINQYDRDDDFADEGQGEDLYYDDDYEDTEEDYEDDFDDDDYDIDDDDYDESYDDDGYDGGDSDDFFDDFGGGDDFGGDDFF